ncbi:MAG: hypothetical protein JEZ11_28190 [Desulfobacterales bacterium]|nr:hypothetical protein [Desulfobacterales bacterium]
MLKAAPYCLYLDLPPLTNFHKDNPIKKTREITIDFGSPFWKKIFHEIGSIAGIEYLLKPSFSETATTKNTSKEYSNG